MNRDPRSAILSAVLGGSLSGLGARQIFVFGAEGVPFWSARNPVAPNDLLQLGHALTLIESMEDARPKPFFAHSPDHDLCVAALDNEEDLYVVVLAIDPDPAHAEARLRRVIDYLAPHASSFREDPHYRAPGPH